MNNKVAYVAAIALMLSAMVLAHRSSAQSEQDVSYTTSASQPVAYSVALGSLPGARENVVRGSETTEAARIGTLPGIENDAVPITNAGISFDGRLPATGQPTHQLGQASGRPGTLPATVPEPALYNASTRP